VAFLYTSGQMVAEDADYSKQNKHKRTSMSPTGFELAIPSIEVPQIYALDHTATGISDLTDY
jgi:hypothetical protein